MSKELIERLRKGFGTAAGRATQVSFYHMWSQKAADAIESLLAENERLNAELAKYRDAPIAAYGVLEDQGSSVISWDAIAGWPEAAHEHINDAIQIWKDSGDFVPKYSVVPLIVKPGEEK